MAYKEIAGTKKYFKYADCDPGDVLVEGKYIREVMGRYGVQYEFEDKSGDIHVLNSAGQLNYKMEFVKEGDLLKVIYDGEVTLEKGAMAGKKAHQFKILKDMDASDFEVDDVDDDELDAFEEL